MGRTIVNELTWSVSRMRLFKECERAYYYNYYGSWGGWDTSVASPLTRKLYILKNLQTLDMWAGGIVHAVIAEALRRYASKKTQVSADQLRETARVKLRQGWIEAVNRDWEEAPKKTNLSELYYGNGTNLPEERTEAVKERIYGCLDAFAESSVLNEIIRVAYMNWKPVDKLDSFLLDDGLKIWCAIDFAYVDEDGRLSIFDWKTGSEKQDELALQLACYAIYAVRKWQAPKERLRLAGVFLRDGARVSEYTIAEDELRNAEEKILESRNEMRSRLYDPANNSAQEKDFPGCENSRICGRCKFREVCSVAVLD